MNRISMRDVIGPEKFDAIIENLTEDQIERGRAISALGRMKHEPIDRGGMTVEQGRRALAEAVAKPVRR